MPIRGIPRSLLDSEYLRLDLTNDPLTGVELDMGSANLTTTGSVTGGNTRINGSGIDFKVGGGNLIIENFSIDDHIIMRVNNGIAQEVLVDFSHTVGADFQEHNLKTTGTGRFDGGLIDSSSVQLIDDSHILYDELGNASIDFSQTRSLVDFVGAPSVDWENRQLIDIASTGGVDWEQKFLFTGGDTILDWSTIGLADFSDSNITTTGNIGIGISPSFPLDIYKNDATTTALFNIEQDGAGDASMRFLLTAARAYSMGVDSTDQLFKISSSASTIASNTLLTLAHTTGDLTLPVGGDLNIKNGGDIRWWDTGSSNYVGFKAPALTANQVWTLPTADGNANEVLQTNGSGVLSFVSGGSHAAIFAELSDSTDQTFGSTGTAQSITFNTNDEISGITHSTSVDPENITIDTDGVYYLIAQPQIHAGAGASGYFHLWLQIDTGGGFADIANSNIEITLASNEENVGVLAETMSLDAGDKIRLRASVGHTGIELDAQTPGGEPAIPSIIFSMFMVGT